MVGSAQYRGWEMERGFTYKLISLSVCGFVQESKVVSQNSISEGKRACVSVILCTYCRQFNICGCKKLIARRQEIFSRGLITLHCTVLLDLVVLHCIVLSFW